LIELLGLSDSELCELLDVDALAIVSGDAEQAPELPILLALLDDAAERQQLGPATLARWVRRGPPGERPLDHLLRRDFPAFELALEQLAQRGETLRGGANGSTAI
jgi:hypothetical protein